MIPFVRHTGRVAALPRVNVDTDQIIPKQFLKRIERTGFGQFLFFDWRLRADGTLHPGFELNQPAAAGASVLLACANFGCGSSREHAPWALAEYGFRALIAPSFADIFFNNCCQNGLLPVVLAADLVAELFRRAQAASNGYLLTVDLEAQQVSDAAGFAASFAIDPYRRELLLRGLDQIGATLLEEARIAAFESRRRSSWAGDSG
ncbi:MAG TPA: 3-isopropylmalate dehydratase small subunit [Gemmatimonadales bacterium]|jgi:3-isopropylmalate/(R)-2-methylmalate dehydratase small subunit|nr:3-isopropylmalate dehydratase small subunit [Gemmatimonadales bacterium]